MVDVVEHRGKPKAVEQEGTEVTELEDSKLGRG
jgi:hypothetical protein